MSRSNARGSTPAIEVPIPEQLVIALRGVLSEGFGLPGNGNVHLIDALIRHGIPVTTARHEAGGVAAADVYYRLSGRVGVATATYGAGVTNIVSPLAEAVRSQTPMLVIVGDVPTSGARPWDVDQTALAASVGAPTVVVTPEDAPDIARRAYNRAVTERLPVVISIPYDLADAASPMPEPTVELITAAPPRGSLDRDVITEASRRLHGAKRPVIVAGRGAVEAGVADGLTRLAEVLGAGRLVTVGARGFFGPETDYLGVMGGFAHDRVAEATRRADVVLVVGASLNPYSMRFGQMFAPDAELIRVDVLAEPPGPASALTVSADARLAVPAILDEVERLGPPASEWAATVAALAGVQSEREAGDDLAPDGRLDPRRVAERLGEMLPADAVVVQDGGHFVGWPNTYWRFRDPSQMIMIGAAHQAVGQAFHGAAGAARARPESLLVVSVGDGGALMGLADLDTVIRSVPRGLVIVWNDASYGAEVHQYVPLGLDSSTMDIREPDFAGIADALGGRGLLVDRIEALDGVRDWLRGGDAGVLLIDCRVSRDIMAPYFAEVVESHR